MSQLYVEFNNPSPDTIEMRPVADQDIKNLAIPDQAVMFRFVTVKDGMPHQESSTYYLGTEAGTKQKMLNDYREHCSHMPWAESPKVTAIGRIAWDFEHEGVSYKGSTFVPLREEGSVMLDRKTREIVWPVAEAPMAKAKLARIGHTRKL